MRGPSSAGLAGGAPRASSATEGQRAYSPSPGLDPGWIADGFTRGKRRWTAPRHQRDSPRKYGFAFVQFSIGLKAQGPPGCHIGPLEQRELGIASRLARNRLAQSRKLGDGAGMDREASFPALLFHAYEWQAIKIESAGRPLGPELDRRCATSKVEMLVVTADQPLDLDVARPRFLMPSGS